MLTSRWLIDAISPFRTDVLTAQLTSYGLSVNISSFKDKLIRDAARCNRFCCDVVYNINEIEDKFREFQKDAEWKPIFIGFRRDGVDGTSYILSNIKKRENRYDEIHRKYFALYSVDIKEDDTKNFYKIIISEYYT